MKFTLDVSKWICGDGRSNAGNGVGEGPSRMLNYDGYMCCLGQFAKQEGCSEDELKHRLTPNEVGKYYSSVFQINRTIDSALALGLMEINDAFETKVQTKIRNIRKKLKEHGHELRVINLKKTLGG